MRSFIPIAKTYFPMQKKKTKVEVASAIAEKMRKSVVLYIKIDLTALAFITTVIGAFKLDTSQAYHFLGSIKEIMYMLLGLSIFGFFLERILLFVGDHPPQHALGVFRVALFVQFAVHVLLLGYIFGGIDAYVDYGLLREREGPTADIIRDKVKDFSREMYRLPLDQSELAAFAKSPDEFYRSIGTRDFGYERTDSNNYCIILSGIDGKFGTSDDSRYPHIMVFRTVHDTVRVKGLK
jgi:hypothetical protein